ncbi:MAG: hypothetical protein DYH07_13275, partial [Armatimonadetes bacterium ATM1]|nr:hypothetical protein [Armatimonadetes bacterium ATM1]
VTSVTSSGQVTSLTYDYEDRVTSIAYPGGGANTFAYSGLGARVSKTDSTGSYTYRRNGSSVTSPVLSDGPNVYTPGISERRSGVSKFYHSDLKNGVQQTDSSQTFAAVRTYDAFGMPVSSSGAWAGPFGYGGKFGYQSDPDSGLMTRDPIKDGRNWYVYCGNNPVSLSDESGLAAARGHHIIPKAVTSELVGMGLSAEAADEFRRSTTGAAFRPARHPYSSLHRQYSSIVRSHVLDFASKNGIQLSRMTRSQARAIILDVVESRNRVVTRMLQHVQNETGVTRSQLVSKFGGRSAGSGGASGSMITLLLATCTAVEGAIRVLIYRSRILAAYAATDGDAAHPESNVYDPVWANLVGYHPEN